MAASWQHQKPEGQQALPLPLPLPATGMSALLTIVLRSHCKWRLQHKGNAEGRRGHFLCWVLGQQLHVWVDSSVILKILSLQATAQRMDRRLDHFHRIPLSLPVSAQQRQVKRVHQAWRRKF